MRHLQNIAMPDYQEYVTTGQTDAGQSDPYVTLCFTGDTNTGLLPTEDCTYLLLGLHLLYVLQVAHGDPL